VPRIVMAANAQNVVVGVLVIEKIVGHSAVQVIVEYSKILMNRGSNYKPCLPG